MERVFLTAFLRETIQRALYSYSIIRLFHCSTQGTRSPLLTYYAYMRKRKLMEGEMNNAKEGGRKERVIFVGIMGAALSGALYWGLCCVWVIRCSGWFWEELCTYSEGTGYEVLLFWRVLSMWSQIHICSSEVFGPQKSVSFVCR